MNTPFVVEPSLFSIPGLVFLLTLKRTFMSFLPLLTKGTQAVRIGEKVPGFFCSGVGTSPVSWPAFLQNLSEKLSALEGMLSGLNAQGGHVYISTHTTHSSDKKFTISLKPNLF